MQYLIGIALALILTVAALAQQLPQQNPMETVLANKLMVEINAGIQCGVVNVNATKQIAELQKQVDDLKAKYEPSK